VELTKQSDSEGDSQGLPGCGKPRSLGRPTIIFELKLYSQKKGGGGAVLEPHIPGVLEKGAGGVLFG